LRIASISITTVYREKVALSDCIHYKQILYTRYHRCALCARYLAFYFLKINCINNTGPQKKSCLCWSTDHTYPLYFEPLNLISILPQHVRVFFNTKKLLDLSIAYPAHLNQTLNVIQHRNFNLTTLWYSSFGRITKN